MLVSICVPLYNVERYIERCAVSLFEQTYSKIEYIFIDDCSPDSSIPVLEKVISRYPERKQNIRIIHHNVNKGLGEARNTAVRESKGEFILHVDSDDYIDKDVVEKLVREQQSTDADIINYPKKIIYKDSISINSPLNVNSPQDWLMEVLSAEKNGNVCGNFIRQSLYKKHNIKVEGGVNQSEDFQVLPRLLFYANTVSSISDSYYYYDRTGETSYSNNLSIKSYNQIKKTIEVLHVFFDEVGHHDLVELMMKGELRGLCKSKMHFSRKGNKQMFGYLCDFIDEIKMKTPVSLPFKYKLMIFVRNYYLFSLLTFLKS